MVCSLLPSHSILRGPLVSPVLQLLFSYKEHSPKLTPSEVLIGWSNSFGNTLPQHLFRHQIRGSVSDHFCNLPKPMVWHLNLPHAVIRQLCGSLKGGRICTPLTSSVFLLYNYFCHFTCEQLSATQWPSSRQDCAEMCAIIPVFKKYRVSPVSTTAGFSLRLRV